MKNKLNDLWLDAIIGVMLIFMIFFAILMAIWNWLKGLSEKPKEKEQEQQQEENTAMYHCFSCGNDFEPEQIVENSDGLTANYYSRKCPKCGNEATIPKSIQHIVCGPPSMLCNL